MTTADFFAKKITKTLQKKPNLVTLDLLLS